MPEAARIGLFLLSTLFNIVGTIGVCVFKLARFPPQRIVAGCSLPLCCERR
jgi:hypothetical protein